MLLADLGADVLRVDRASGAALVGPNADFRTEVMHRGRQSVAVDLKSPRGREVVLELVKDADALMEGFRPGVAERLGIGPEDCWAVNPRLVYGRMTGYGQDGPMAQAVGHDLNYVAQSGVLAMVGRAGQPPTPPLSLVGDFGGGGMVLALGILAAVWEAQRSGRGQVVDAAMADGAALLGAAFHGFVSAGTWQTDARHQHRRLGGAVLRRLRDRGRRWLAVAAMERRFYAELLEILEIDPDVLPDQYDQVEWPRMKKVFADAVRARTRDEWVARAAGRGCVSAMLEVEESWRAPAQRGPGHVRRGRRRDPAQRRSRGSAGPPPSSTARRPLPASTPVPRSRPGASPTTSIVAGQRRRRPAADSGG